MKNINMDKCSKLKLVTGALLLSSTMIAQADVVHNDDVIITGSSCTGFDCVNGESFGFDTIKLKENNLRIYFDDTSTSASFPRNDWRITINDSANGGDSYFGIDDATSGRRVFRIDAGAPSNSLYVDSGGDVGIGTSNPVVDLHVVSGNTPTLRLEQNGSSGFSAQTWDVAGNEANFFIRDATNGSTLPLRIQPSAPSNSVYIASDGDVGIGTNSPSSFFSGSIESTLNVRTTDQHTTIAIDSSDNKAGFLAFSNIGTGNGRWFLSGRNNFDSPSDRFSILNATPLELFTILQNGNIGFGVTNPSFPIEHSSGARLDGGSWLNASSRTLKQDINQLEVKEAYATLMKLNPVTFSYKTNPEEKTVGFIAEDVPELVAVNERDALSPMDIVAVLTKVVQEQQKNILILNFKIAELQKLKE